MLVGLSCSEVKTDVRASTITRLPEMGRLLLDQGQCTRRGEEDPVFCTISPHPALLAMHLDQLDTVSYPTRWPEDHAVGFHDSRGVEHKIVEQVAFLLAFR